MSVPRILSVGQCSFDSGQIGRFLAKEFHAEVETADRATEAITRLRTSRFDLVLVNRIGDRDGAPGLDLITAMKADPQLASVPVMLVSNLRDSQQEASAAGAEPGFGKADLNSSRAVDVVGAILSAPARRSS